MLLDSGLDELDERNDSLNHDDLVVQLHDWVKHSSGKKKHYLRNVLGLLQISSKELRHLSLGQTCHEIRGSGFNQERFDQKSSLPSEEASFRIGTFV